MYYWSISVVSRSVPRGTLGDLETKGETGIFGTELVSESAVNSMGYEEISG